VRAAKQRRESNKQRLHATATAPIHPRSKLSGDGRPCSILLQCSFFLYLSVTTA
jgi:hypothetical protein